MIGRLLAMDYGTKRIGVAISDPLRITSRGLKVIERVADGKDLDEIAAIVLEEQVTGIVLGLPRHSHGAEGEMAKLVRDFGAEVAERTGLPVHFSDETYSSLEADDILREKHNDPKKRKAERDIIAAQVILRNYLQFGS